MAVANTGSGLKGLSAGRSDLYSLPFENIEVVAGWNVREELEGVDTIENVEAIADEKLRDHIIWLVQNISELGIKEPLKGYYDKVTKTAKLTNGHCRYTALKVLRNSFGKTDILVPFLPEERSNNEGDRIASMLVSNSGLELNPIEKAKVIRRLADYGWDNSKIGKMCKPQLSTVQVENLLELSSATPTIEELVKTGLVSPTTVINEIKAVGADRAELVIQKTLEIAEQTESKPTGDLAKEIRKGLLATGELVNNKPSKKVPDQAKSKAKVDKAKEAQKHAIQLAVLKACMQNAKVVTDADGKVTVTMEFKSQEDWSYIEMAIKANDAPAEVEPETKVESVEIETQETEEETNF